VTQRLEGKVGVVTGAGMGGIGEAVAFDLAKEGARVMVNDIGHDGEGYLADKTVKRIKGSGGTAIANYDSVALMDGAKNIVEAAVKNFGRIDILVNCAGSACLKSFIDMTEEDWDSVVSVHLKAHFNCAKVAVPYMIQQGGGRIINFCSRAAAFGGPDAAYASGKAGIIGFTVTLAAELRKYHITVNAIFPSAKTKLVARPPTELKERGYFSDNMPTPMAWEPEYVAPMVVYLTTGEANWITGKFFYVSGGDICTYAHPFQLPGPHMFVRKVGKWTVEEISKIISSMLGKTS
jgi:NAD(P)-dependent dehydrogenase (short-subunit alcohol dehydrogenase family)